MLTCKHTKIIQSDINAAADRIKPYVPVTNLTRSHYLSELIQGKNRTSALSLRPEIAINIKNIFRECIFERRTSPNNKFVQTPRCLKYNFDQ